MIELVWFAAGVVATAGVVWLRARLRTRSTGRDSPPPAPAPIGPGPIAVGARRLARTIGSELANLVSGVEGRAHNLIACAPDRRQLPVAAEAMLDAVQRLRTLHKKVAAFGEIAAPVPGRSDVAEIIASMHDELQQMQLGLEVRWEPSPRLPPILVAPEVAHDALLFLCSALLRAERGATHLSIAAELCFANDTPRVQIELALEWITESSQSGAMFEEPGFSFDFESANKLIAGHGGEVALSHLPGRTVRAIVCWPAATDAEAAAELQTAAGSDDGERHRYGGALVLEADPAIRAMLAHELKSTGRAVFACADVAAARSFLEATPDRFEVLIVDHPQRLDADDTLLPTIRANVPDLKICVLGPCDSLADREWPRLHRIEKPFGVDELRRALASVLATG